MTTDLTWLPLSIRKGIELPKVVFEPTHWNYGGYYENNKIVVVDHGNDAACLAHEFCHYLQDLRGSRNSSSWTLKGYSSYNKAIRQYFRSQPWEMEALLFERKYAPNDVNKFWLGGLVLPDKFNEELEM